MAETSAASAVLTKTPAGLYCPAGDFHIDPLRGARARSSRTAIPIMRAPAPAQVLATDATLAIMRARLGPNFAGATQAARYGEPIVIGAARVTFVPAGHVLGSAQILIEAQGRRVVVSGDYKRAHDPTCAPFEPIRCDAFVSEATFGLPVFRHPPAADEVAKLLASLRVFPERAHVVGAYSLGKAQRLLALLLEAGWDRPVYVHGAMESMIALYRSARRAHGRDASCHAGRQAEARRRDRPLSAVCGLRHLAAQDARSARRLRVGLDAGAGARAPARRRTAARRFRPCRLARTLRDGEGDRLFEELWVTHGAEEALVHWAQTQGLAARPLHMIGFGEEDEGLDEDESDGEGAPA